MQRNKCFLTISYLAFATSLLHAAHGSQSAAAQDFRAYDQRGFRIISFNRSPNTPRLVFDPFRKMWGEATVFLSRDLGSRSIRLKTAAQARLAQILDWATRAQSEPASLEPALDNFTQEIFWLLRLTERALEHSSEARRELALFDFLTYLKENHDKLKPLCDELKEWSDQAQFVRKAECMYCFSRTRRPNEKTILTFKEIPGDLKNDVDQGYLACAKFYGLMKTYGYGSMLCISEAPELWKTREKPLNTPFTMTDTLATFGDEKKEEKADEASSELDAAFLAAGLSLADARVAQKRCNTQ